MRLAFIVPIVGLIASTFALPISLSWEDHIEITDPTLSATENALMVNLPQARIQPTSPLYTLKRSWEDLQLFITRSPEKKIELLLHLADLRLSESISAAKHHHSALAKQLLHNHDTLIGDILKLQENQDSTPIGTSALSAAEEKKAIVHMLSGEYQIQWERE